MGRKFSSTSRATGLAVAVTSSATSMQVQSVAGLPAVPFTLIVDWGTESEEIVEVTSVAGLSLTVIRGVDGTAGLPHQVGAVIRHGATARDFRDFVNHSEAETNVHGLTGGAAVVGTSQTQTLTNKTIDGGQNTVTNLPTASLADNAVTKAKMADSSVGTAELENLAVTTAKLGDGSTTTAKLADGAATTLKLGDGAVTTVKLGDAQVTAAKLADDAVTKAKMADDSVGAAEIEAGAVGATELASSSVTTVKVADAAVTAAKFAADARATVVTSARATVSDAVLTANTDVGLTGTTVTAPAGVYLVTARACLYASGSPGSGSIYIVYNAVKESARWDITEGLPQSPTITRVVTHGGGSFAIEVGYRTNQTGIMVTGVAGGLTSITAVRVGVAV